MIKVRLPKPVKCYDTSKRKRGSEREPLLDQATGEAVEPWIAIDYLNQFVFRRKEWCTGQVLPRKVRRLTNQLDDKFDCEVEMHDDDVQSLVDTFNKKDFIIPFPLSFQLLPLQDCFIEALAESRKPERLTPVIENKEQPKQLAE